MTSTLLDATGHVFTELPDRLANLDLFHTTLPLPGQKLGTWPCRVSWKDREFELNFDGAGSGSIPLITVPAYRYVSVGKDGQVQTCITSRPAPGKNGMVRGAATYTQQRAWPREPGKGGFGPHAGMDLDDLIESMICEHEAMIGPVDAVFLMLWLAPLDPNKTWDDGATKAVQAIAPWAYHYSDRVKEEDRQQAERSKRQYENREGPWSHMKRRTPEGGLTAGRAA